jgi:hypothetical protein
VAVLLGRDLDVVASPDASITDAQIDCQTVSVNLLGATHPRGRQRDRDLRKPQDRPALRAADGPLRRTAALPAIGLPRTEGDHISMAPDRPTSRYRVSRSMYPRFVQLEQFGQRLDGHIALHSRRYQPGTEPAPLRRTRA